MHAMKNGMHCQSTLPEIIERQCWQGHDVPGQRNRLAPKVPNVGVESLHARNRENHRAHRA